MKYIAFIVLGLVLLAAIAGVVLWANMPAPRLRICAVQPVSTNFTWTDLARERHSSPVWKVAITNTGNVAAHWNAYILLKNEESLKRRDCLSPFQVSVGALPPNAHTNIYMAAPADSAVKWTAGVQYWPIASPAGTPLPSWLASVPALRRPFSRTGVQSTLDAWHTGTNVTANY